MKECQMYVLLMDVNAIEGVKVCPRMMEKCQNATRVTRIGEPFLVTHSQLLYC